MGSYVSRTRRWPRTLAERLPTSAARGPDRALWWSENDGSTNGGTWFNTASLGGQLADGPAISVTTLGPTFYVEGVDGAAYERGLARPFGVDGGSIKFGTGATALY